ncbi:MAG: precorrin-3B synthase [Mycobacteriaceae bacterium]|nr:precorrin-3B synthase [Mycobacteriaceae bacterium]
MTRTRDDDACPGALQLHQASDGALARVRLPGGAITAGQLDALARAASRFGCPALELTSRGNLQIRGITDAAAVAGAVAAAGLLPSAVHDRVRNVVASPLSGRAGAHADVRGWVVALDEAIRAEPALAGLPGRFWFAIDDGRGDVSGLGADVGAHVLGDAAALLLAGRDTGVRLSPADVVPALVTVAARFARLRGKAWRVAELSDEQPLLDGLAVSAAPDTTWPSVTRPPVGWIKQINQRITLGAAVPLGVLPVRTARFLAATGAPMAITPWRSVLIFDLEEGVAETALGVLAPLGLIFDDDSPWLNVSACTGSPGCRHALADVRADAAASLTPHGPHRHYVGCERACGSPPTGEVLVATGDGYRRLRRQP